MEKDTIRPKEKLAQFNQPKAGEPKTQDLITEIKRLSGYPLRELGQITDNLKSIRSEDKRTTLEARAEVLRVSLSRSGALIKQYEGEQRDAMAAELAHLRDTQPTSATADAQELPLPGRPLIERLGERRRLAHNELIAERDQLREINKQLLAACKRIANRKRPCSQVNECVNQDIRDARAAIAKAKLL